jgi:hypothetical protein
VLAAVSYEAGDLIARRTGAQREVMTWGPAAGSYKTETVIVHMPYIDCDIDVGADRLHQGELQTYVQMSRQGDDRRRIRDASLLLCLILSICTDVSEQPVTQEHKAGTS